MTCVLIRMKSGQRHRGNNEQGSHYGLRVQHKHKKANGTISKSCVPGMCLLQKNDMADETGESSGLFVGDFRHYAKECTFCFVSGDIPIPSFQERQ